MEYLARLRWPDGFVCPQCGANKSWRTNRGLWSCQQCGVQTSVTAGTIFHRTRKPLRLWFRTMWHITAQKYGTNALGLRRVVEPGCYETSWQWLHKLRRAMVRTGTRPTLWVRSSRRNLYRWDVRKAVSVAEEQKGKLSSSSALKTNRRRELDGFASSMWRMLLQRALGALSKQWSNQEA